MTPMQAKKDLFERLWNDPAAEAWLDDAVRIIKDAGVLGILDCVATEIEAAVADDAERDDGDEDLGDLACTAKRGAMLLLYGARVADRAQQGEPPSRRRAGGSGTEGRASPWGDAASDLAHVCEACGRWLVECTCRRSPSRISCGATPPRAATLIKALAERVSDDGALAYIISPQTTLGRLLCEAIAEMGGLLPRDVMAEWRAEAATRPRVRRVVVAGPESLPELAEADVTALSVPCAFCGALPADRCELPAPHDPGRLVHGHRAWVGRTVEQVSDLFGRATGPAEPTSGRGQR